MNASEYVGVLPDQAEMAGLRKSIRAWAILLIISGGLSFIASEVFDPGWGIVLITVAILSWKIKTPAMFVIYSVLLGWAALSNVFAAIPAKMGWLILAFMQVFWTVATVLSYKRYNHLPNNNEAKVLCNFGKASGILSILCIVLPPTSCLGVFAYILTLGEAAMATPSPQVEQLLTTFFTYASAFVSLAVLALGLGIAAMTGKDNHKGWPIAGIVMSSIVLAGWIALSILGALSLLFDQTGALPFSI